MRAGDDADTADDSATLTHAVGGGDALYAALADVTLAVTVGDDDAPGVTVSKTALAVPEGGSATYTVRLNTQPASNVVIAVAKATGGSDDVTVDADAGTAGVQTEMTFTPDNWNAARTVTVSAAADDDAVDDAATLTHAVVAASSDDAYDAVSVADVAVTVDDDETAGLVLAPSPLTLLEGASATYEVALASEPTADVTVTFSFAVGSDADVTLDTDPDMAGDQATALTFTAGDWDVAQTVTVRAAEDPDSAPDAATVVHTASGGDYAGVSASLSVTANDNDTPGVTVSRTALEVPEGASASYTLVLNTRPATDVTIAVGKAAGGSAEVTFDTDAGMTGEQATLTFTADNWNAAQTVTVSAAEDDDAADDAATLTHQVVAASSDDTYDAVTIADVAVTVDDDETAGLTLAPSPLTLLEGASATYEVALASEPTAEVTVTLSLAAGSDADVTVDADAGTTGDQNTLTFTADNWDVAQAVTVRAAEDADTVADTATVVHTAGGGDYAGVSADLAVTANDNDTPGVTVSRTALEVPEGGNATYTVVLNTQPASNVVVAVAKAAGGSDDVTFDTDAGTTGVQTEMTFTPDNWNAARTVTVSAAADDDAVDDTATLTHAVVAASSDNAYDAVTVADVAVTVDDDETAALVLAPSPLTLLEGASATYEVALSSEPTADVTVAVAFAAGSDADVTLDTDPDMAGDQATALTFTAGDWDVAQTVTVRAAEDPDSAPDAATVVHTASGGDYAGVSASLSVTANDNDTPGVTVSRTALAVPEGGNTTYEVVLNTRPATDVTIAVTRAAGGSDDVTFDTDAGTAGAQTEMTFATANWNVAQTVTVSAAHDDDAADDAATLTHQVVAASSDDAYDAVTVADVAVTVDDDETAALVLAPSPLTLLEGASATYEVALASEPTADVTVTLSLAAGSDADVTVDTDAGTTGDQSTLTFTADDWDVAQTVTVRAAEDADTVADTATVVHTAGGGDYAGRARSSR